MTTQPTRGPWRAVQFETDKPWLICSTEAGFALAHVDTEANARVIAASWDMWFELQRLHRLYGHEQTANVLAKVSATQEPVS